MELKYIFSVFSGPTLRQSTSDLPEGPIAVLQMKDVSFQGFTVGSAPNKISDIGFHPHHYLKKGDILFLRAGANNFAVYYDGRFPLAVASSMFFVLRPLRSDVLSEYVALFLNQPTAQAKIHPVKAGTSVTNVTKAMLEQLNVPLPPIEMQKKIVEAHHQLQLEKAISEDIISNKSMLLNSIMSNPVKDKPMQIQPDDIALWDGYFQPMHLVKVRLKSPVTLAGKTEHVTSFIGAIVHYDQHQKFFFVGNTRYGYPAVKEWRIVEKFDLRTYNNDTLPQDRPKFENVIPHELVESMELVPSIIQLNTIN
jgi:hypothetical protein